MDKKPHINPKIQPASGFEVYKGGFGFSSHRKLYRTLNTIINFLLVIGLAVFIIAWMLLESA